MAKDEGSNSGYYIDPDSGMLIAGGSDQQNSGSGSQGDLEWTPEQLQAWEEGNDASYEQQGGGTNYNASAPSPSSYAALGNAFGKSTWNTSTTAEEEDWTGIGEPAAESCAMLSVFSLLKMCP